MTRKLFIRPVIAIVHTVIIIVVVIVIIVIIVIDSARIIRRLLLVGSGQIVIHMANERVE